MTFDKTVHLPVDKTGAVKAYMLGIIAKTTVKTK